MGGQFSAWGDETRAEENDMTEHSIIFTIEEGQAAALLKLLRRVTPREVALLLDQPPR